MDLLAFILMSIFLYMCLYLFWMWFCFDGCFERRQKTSSLPQRRIYAGSRSRPSVPQEEPTIYVSPSNYPPPPKYEAMAPPSYEEVCGVHYPYQQAVQPITQPITAAMSETRSETSTVITVTAENRRTSVALATT